MSERRRERGTRTFVAVWPDEATMAAVATLPRPEVAGLRWTTQDQWHVTLRFLGDLDTEELAGLERVLRSVAARLAPRPATLGPATAVLGHQVVMVPVSGLDDVAESVLAATERLGKPPEHRDFVGHLTLARRRRGRVQVAEVAGTPIESSFRVEALSIVASELHPEGARYSTVARVPLTG